MLKSADRSLTDVLRAFSAHSVEVGLLVPTGVGLEKSILDAHGQLRAYFTSTGLHDYAAQLQGSANKVRLSARLIRPNGLTPAVASLYRPPSKKGDPRIWISGLRSYASAGNVLAIFSIERVLYVVNASDPSIIDGINDPSHPLGQAIALKATTEGGALAELLTKLRAISSSGYVSSLRTGTTGVGMTLETLLGISANSSRAPDYRGIEIKTSRLNKSRNRITLFSKTPDWANSAISNSVSLVQTYGYNREGRQQLYCSLKESPNSQGLFLKVEGDLLKAMHRINGIDSPVMQWNLEDLREALASKHNETLWVKARTRKDSTGEHFHYISAVHTHSPMLTYLEALFEIGAIELDLTLHLKDRSEGQKPATRDHGYLFKIHPSNLDLLFPPSTTYAFG